MIVKSAFPCFQVSSTDEYKKVVDENTVIDLYTEILTDLNKCWNAWNVESNVDITIFVNLLNFTISTKFFLIF